MRVPPGEGSEGAYALDVQGKRHKVVVTENPLRTRPGDILLAQLEPTLVYRPATRTVAPPADVPDDAISFAVDEQGTIWSLEQSLTDAPTGSYGSATVEPWAPRPSRSPTRGTASPRGVVPRRWPSPRTRACAACS